jgi:hypothetical protein
MSAAKKHPLRKQNMATTNSMRLNAEVLQQVCFEMNLFIFSRYE